MILAIGFKDDASASPQTVTTWPVGYDTLQEEANNVVNTGGIIAVSIDIITGSAAENPSAYTMSAGADEWAAATIALRPGISLTREQDGFRFEDDDGTESGSTFLAAQNVDINRGPENPFRLRQGVQYVGNPDAESVEVQYKENGDADSEYRTVS
jgi:hypothetical protein